MILNIFSVYDEKSHAYLTPFYMLHLDQAIRTFEDCVNSRDHQFSHHPQDYTLFHIGSFDDSTAETSVIIATSLGNGVEFKSREQQQYLEGLEPDAQQISNDEPTTLQSGSKS